MFKKIIKSNGFKIYFWPTVVYLLFIYIWMLIFFLSSKDYSMLQPGSFKEVAFVAGGGAATVSYLWAITFRYKKIKRNQVNKRTKAMLIVITSVYLFVLIKLIYVYFLA